MDNYWDSGNREIAFNNKPSKEGRDMEKAQAVFDYSSALVGYKPNPLIARKPPGIPELPPPPSS